jgi:trehalose synthase
MADLDENELIVNALQRQASVIVKKSVQEGFGLGITEGMWKVRPVIATRVGGQADQIIDRETGILLDNTADLEGFGAAVAMLLDDTEGGAARGRRGRERGRGRYLADRHFIGWTRTIADTIASRPHPRELRRPRPSSNNGSTSRRSTVSHAERIPMTR